MAVTKQQKIDILAGLVAQFKEAKSIGFSTTNGLTVAEFSELRSGLREVESTYALAKKTLIVKAAKEALNVDISISDLSGQVGIVFSNQDSVSGLGKANDFIKKINGKKGDLGKMAWALSIFEGEVKTLEETKVIAGLPTRETLLSRMVGSLMSPLSGMARFLDAAAKEVEAQGKTKAWELEGKKEEVVATEGKTEEA